MMTQTDPPNSRLLIADHGRDLKRSALRTRTFVADPARPRTRDRLSAWLDDHVCVPDRDRHRAMMATSAIFSILVPLALGLRAPAIVMGIVLMLFVAQFVLVVFLASWTNRRCSQRIADPRWITAMAERIPIAQRSQATARWRDRRADTAVPFTVKDVIAWARETRATPTPWPIPTRTATLIRAQERAFNRV